MPVEARGGVRSLTWKLQAVISYNVLVTKPNLQEHQIFLTAESCLEPFLCKFKIKMYLWVPLYACALCMPERCWTSGAAVWGMGIERNAMSHLFCHLLASCVNSQALLNLRESLEEFHSVTAWDSHPEAVSEILWVLQYWNCPGSDFKIHSIEWGLEMSDPLVLASPMMGL